MNANEIAQFRNQLGINQELAARLFGTSRTQIALCESGNRVPSPQFQLQFSQMERLLLDIPEVGWKSEEFDENIKTALIAEVKQLELNLLRLNQPFENLANAYSQGLRLMVFCERLQTALPDLATNTIALLEGKARQLILNRTNLEEMLIKRVRLGAEIEVLVGWIKKIDVRHG